jgi:hypothetical protein
MMADSLLFFGVDLNASLQLDRFRLHFRPPHFRNAPPFREKPRQRREMKSNLHREGQMATVVLQLATVLFAQRRPYKVGIREKGGNLCGEAGIQVPAAYAYSCHNKRLCYVEAHCEINSKSTFS